MRVAGQHKAVDAQRRVFEQACNHGFGVAHQRGAGAATHQADARPQVRRDFQLVEAPTVQRGHAPLAFGIHTGVVGLGRGDAVAVQVADQFIGGGPGLGVCFTHDDVQAHAEAHLAPVHGGAGAHIGDLFGDRRRWLSPGQVGIYVFGREFVRGGRRTAKVQRRVGALYRFEEVARALDLEVLAFKVDPLALEQAADDLQVFIGCFIALVMGKEHTIGGQLHGITAGHHIEQQPPVAGLIQRRDLTRRRRGVAQRGAQRHQQLDALGHRHQAGGRDPWVQATGAGGD